MSDEAPKPLTIREKEFIRGYACACALVGNPFGLGMPTAAEEILGEGGFTKSDLLAAGVEQCDIDHIFPMEATP